MAHVALEAGNPSTHREISSDASNHYRSGNWKAALRLAGFAKV